MLVAKPAGVYRSGWIEEPEDDIIPLLNYISLVTLTLPKIATLDAGLEISEEDAKSISCIFGWKDFNMAACDSQVRDALELFH